MLTATTLIATIAVVSLGSGALFLAGSQGPSPMASPSTSAASPSPSAMPWTPPEGLVSQEVSPGVRLVTDDGAGHPLRYTWARGGVSDFAFGPDGSIWLLDQSGLIRVGHEERYPVPGPTDSFRDLTAAPDGTLWALANDTVASFRDGVWTEASPFPGKAPAGALEILPDGTIWAGSTTTLARLDGDSWAASPIGDESGPIAGGGVRFPGDLAWTPDGGLWVTVCEGRLGDRREPLRFDGSTWQTDAPSDTGDRCINPITTGRDGVIWAFIQSRDDRAQALAWNDGTGWELSSEDAGIPRIGAVMGYVGTMAVGHDGRVWATGDHRGGLVLGVLGSYDGAQWTDVYAPSLDSGMVLLEHPLKVAPDGSIWLLTDEGFMVVDE